jgi:hypothetical protein
MNPRTPNTGVGATCMRSEKGQKQTNTIDRQASIGDQERRAN